MFISYYRRVALVIWGLLIYRGLVAAATLQFGCSSTMNTHRVVNVKPFRRVGLHKLAIDEQLGGGLEDQRSI